MEPAYQSLYELIVRRLRLVPTIFGQNVKLVLRQREEEHWSSLPLPYLLVVPTVTRPETARPQMEIDDILVVPHSVTFVAQLDGRGSEAEHLAAADIEVAEKQLIWALLPWRPTACYMATQYSGFRVSGSRLPDVKVSFVFIFPEEVGLPDEVVIGIDEAEELEVGRIAVNVGGTPCCPPDEPPGAVPPINVFPQPRRL